MRVSKKSWHYKVYTWEDELKDLPIESSCEYIKTVAGNLASVIAFVVLILVILGFLTWSLIDIFKDGGKPIDWFLAVVLIIILSIIAHQLRDISAKNKTSKRCGPVELVD